MSEIENNDMLPANGSHDPEIASAPISAINHGDGTCYRVSSCAYGSSTQEKATSWLGRRSAGPKDQDNLVEDFARIYIRRFIKRKDSDAGEAVVAMTFNFMIVVGIIMANKLVMSKVGFNFPIFLTLIHYTSAYILLAIFKALSFLPASPPSKSTPFSSLFALGAVMAFASGLANASLKHNSVGFYQMSKIAVTPTIVFAEFILFRKSILFHKIIALIVLSIGVAVATVTDLEFNIFGACIAFAWIVPSAVNKILWSSLQQQGNWTALALMWKTTPITIFFLVALMPWLDPPGVLSFKWDLNNSTAIIISALLGFLLQWSGALALGATSATSHVVLGQFKTCVILLGGYCIFDSDPGIVSIYGAVTALCGTSIYTSLNMKEPRDKSDRSLSSLKPKSSDESEENADVNHTINAV